MFGASSQLVRSWFEAEIWPIIQLASSELARASRFAAKFHYASWFGAGSERHEPASNMFGASSELASVMEFGFYQFSAHRYEISPGNSSGTATSAPEAGAQGASPLGGLGWTCLSPLFLESVYLTRLQR